MRGRALPCLFADLPSDSITIRRVPQDVLCGDVDHGSSFVILLKHARVVIVRSLDRRPARRVNALLQLAHELDERAPHANEAQPAVDQGRRRLEDLPGVVRALDGPGCAQNSEVLSTLRAYHKSAAH